MMINKSDSDLIQKLFIYCLVVFGILVLISGIIHISSLDINSIPDRYILLENVKSISPFYNALTE